MYEVVKTVVPYLRTRLAVAVKDRRAISAIEYGVLAAFIAVGIITAVTALGTNVSSLFTGLGTKLAGEAPS